MSEAEMSPNPSIDTRFMRIEQHRHLIGEETREMSGVMEYFDALSGKRILTIPKATEQAKIHEKLLAKRVPVYPILARDNRNVLLDVPKDARTVQSNLKFIARDVLSYKEIFSQVGEVLGRCAVNGFGLPTRGVGRSVLSGIGFSLNDVEAFGGNVHLLPPYVFDNEQTKQQELDMLSEELVQSDYITPAIAFELTAAASQGWEHVRPY